MDLGSFPPEPPEPGPRTDRPAGSSFFIRDLLWEPGPSGPAPEEGRRPTGQKKPRKARTAFSDLQLTRLETSFQRQKYLNVQDRMELAASLQLSDTQVKTWYQNRRTKWKRQSAAGLELLAEAGRMFLPTHFLYPHAPPMLDFYLYRSHAHSRHHHAPADS